MAWCSLSSIVQGSYLDASVADIRAPMRRLHRVSQNSSMLSRLDGDFGRWAESLSSRVVQRLRHSAVSLADSQKPVLLENTGDGVVLQRLGVYQLEQQLLKLDMSSCRRLVKATAPAGMDVAR